MALICRTSPRPDGGTEGVDDQEKWGRAYAEAHWPGVPVEVFADRAVSATKGDERPGLERYLDWLDADRIAHAWAVAQDRVSRELDGRYPWFRVARVMADAGVAELHTDRDGVVLVEDAVAGIKAVLANEETRRLKRRVRDKKDEFRDAGKLRRLLGGTPVLGYAWNEGDAEWHTEPGAVGLIRYVAGAVLGDPEHRVTTAYVKAMRLAPNRAVRDAAGRPVTEKMIRAALQRPATAGLITARDDPGKVVGRAAGIADPPLDEETWLDLAEVFRGRKLGRRVSDEKYKLGPLLRCGKCGNQMSGEMRKGTAVLRVPEPAPRHRDHPGVPGRLDTRCAR